MGLRLGDVAWIAYTIGMGLGAPGMDDSSMWDGRQAEARDGEH